MVNEGLLILAALLVLAIIPVTWAVRTAPRRGERSAPGGLGRSVFAYCANEGAVRPHLRHADGSLRCWYCPPLSGGAR